METKHEASMARTLRAEQHQNTEDHHATCDDTNQRVRCTLTYKQFVGFSVAMFIAMALFMTVSGKMIRGTYWFEAGNEEWLWSSHFISCAILEDDSKFLMINDGAPWEEFKKRASTIRLNGFIRIVHDGEHPNLQQWYARDHDEIAGH